MTARVLLPLMGLFLVSAMAANAQRQEPVGPINGMAPTDAPLSQPNGTANKQQSTLPMPATAAVPASPQSSAPAASTNSAPAANATSAVSAAPAAPAKIEVPTGTHLPLILHNAISTRSAKPGDPVYFETNYPILIDGHVVIPAGSYVSGEVTQSKRAGKVKGRAQLAVRLNNLILPNAYQVTFAAAPSNAGTGGGETTNGEGVIVGDSDKASDAGTVIRTTEAGTGIGAGVGAASGNIGRGVGIGAGAGAAAGLLAVLLTRGPDAELPRGTTLDAVLDRPIFLDSDKVQFTSPGTSTSMSGPPDREPQRQKVPF
jgi:hypothetical protein